MFNMGSLLDDGAQRFGERVAFYHYETSSAVTYRGVLAAANRVGNALRAAGIEIENRVGLLLEDSFEFVFAQFGALRIGATVVPMNTLLPASDYQFMLDDCRARALFVCPALLPRIREIRPALQHLRCVVVCGETLAGPGEIALRDFIAETSPLLEVERTSRNDIASFCYTSGSTGRPRAIMIRHDYARLTGEHGWGFGEGDVQFHIPKLYFATSQGALLEVFRAGAAMALLSGRPTAETVMEVIARYRPAFLAGPPTIFARMVEAAREGHRADLSSVRYVFSAGEALTPEIYRRFYDTFGKELSNRWGAAELMGAPLGFPYGQTTSPDKIGSAGRVCQAGAEVKIVDDLGQDVPNNVPGYILVRTPTMMAGYWHQPEETFERIFGGWLKLGDLFVRDAEGYYWYRGRGDDMVKVAGRQVFPAEVEAVLVRHPSVLECAVVDVKDDQGLAELVALVVPKKGYVACEALASELQALVKRELAPYKRPHRVDFVKELCRTGTGKVQRFRLREQAEASQPWRKGEGES